MHYDNNYCYICKVDILSLYMYSTCMYSTCVQYMCPVTLLAFFPYTCTVHVFTVQRIICPVTLLTLFPLIIGGVPH